MLLSVPGWRRIRRYRLVHGMDAAGPDFLSLHELAGPEVFENATYRAAISTPWRDRIVGSALRRERRVFGFRNSLAPRLTRLVPRSRRDPHRPKLADVASLNDSEVRDFLLQGTRTGKLSYLAASGQPLVTPIWFIIEGDSIVFNTGMDTAKGRSLARDPRTCLCVDLQEPPYGFVQVQGEAELSQDPAELLRTATAIAARYMGPDARGGIRQAQRRARRAGGAAAAGQGARGLQHDRLSSGRSPCRRPRRGEPLGRARFLFRSVESSWLSRYHG